MTRKPIFIVAAVLLCTMARPARTCSTFYMMNGGHPVFGKNYDWDVENGLVVVNKRGVRKTAMAEDNPAVWTAMYGSVTFNQYGRELPSGGMNEVGLVVELMWLDEATYPEPDERPSVGNTQWIQYQLDNSATVEDVIESDAHLRISPAGSAKIHYLVGDRQGHCAAIEFIDGKLVAHSGEAMPATVLTNHSYERSLAYLGEHVGFGGSKPIERTMGSLDRFACAADMVRTFDPAASASAVEYAFDILETVAQGNRTMWSIVYDIAGRRIHFRTHSVPGRRVVRLDGFDFACDSPVEVFDMSTDATGDITARFEDYTYRVNRELIGSAFGQTSFLEHFPSESLDWLARYPDTLECDTHRAQSGR